MSYIEGLNDEQRKNIHHIINAFRIKNITNKFTQSAILAVVSKECEFLPKSETPYNKTSNGRIREIFGTRIAKLSEDELTNLKQNPKQFFDVIYGGRFGNQTDEGYLYRGRGFNQLTFKDNYRKIASDIGVDIVKNPDLMNDVEVATLALVQYFVNRIKAMPDDLKKYYDTDGINGFKTLHQALQAIYHANAGFGKSIEIIKADKTGGLRKATNRITDFNSIVNTTK